MKKHNKTTIMAFAAMAMLALAGCEKHDTLPTAASADFGSAYGVPYIEVLSVEKDYDTVGESGRIYTTSDLLFSKIHAKVSLTKNSKRKATLFSLQETETAYVVTAKRMKDFVCPANAAPAVSTSDPHEITEWVLEATLDGGEACICFDEEADRWSGQIVNEA